MKRGIGEGSKAEIMVQMAKTCRGIREDCRKWILSHRRSYPVNSRMFSPESKDANLSKHPLRRG